MKIVPEIDVPAHAVSFTKVWPDLKIENQVSSGHSLIDHFDLTNPKAVAKIKEIFDDYTKMRHLMMRQQYTLVLMNSCIMQSLIVSL